MQPQSYEKHSLQDPNFPLSFHPAIEFKSTVGFESHWHEHIELLYFMSGNAEMTVNTRQLFPKKGELAVVNSNCMHSMPYRSLDCRYYCIIINKNFFDGFFSPMKDIAFGELIADNKAGYIFELIAGEMEQKNGFYKQTVKAYTTLLLSLLARNFRVPVKMLEDKRLNQRLSMVKAAIGYISIHYKEDISIDDIVRHIGFSKYHFCHAFKEITGQTSFDYINILRCNEARRLIFSGKYNVSESALLSGFNNFSYFTRTYKKYMGVLPSREVLGS